MHRKVRTYIEKNNLFATEAKVVVALSGGADSVALLHILLRLGCEVTAAHCNFHLRGEESLRDEMFVRGLCERVGVELRVAQFDTTLYASEKRISVEMAARELRYDFFEKLRAEVGADVIAVAHHRDDVAETVLLNLMRGSGIRGLHGIRPKNGYIVRPLLCVGRDEVMEYLKSIGESYVTDSTNLASDYTRNKIRLEIMPLMREINPSIAETLADSARRIAAAEKVYTRGIEEGVKRVLNDSNISISALLQEPSPLSLLHEILSPLGFNGAQSEDILENIGGASGREYQSGTHIVTRDRERLIISPIDKLEAIEELLPHCGTVATPYGILTIESMPFDGTIEKHADVAMLDMGKLKFPLTLRNIRRGDRFVPLGMRGSKLVSDYLTDRKVPLPRKRRQLAVVDSDDKIVWLVGERVAAPFAIGEGTANVLRLGWSANA